MGAKELFLTDTHTHTYTYTHTVALQISQGNPLASMYNTHILAGMMNLTFSGKNKMSASSVSVSPLKKSAATD